ncbi:MAG: hypothetical protein ACXWP5_09790, partial [Bdellovibrionota bacterium]
LGNASLPWDQQGDFESEVNSWYEHELLKKLFEIREIVRGTSFVMNQGTGTDKIAELLDGEFEKIRAHFTALDDDFTDEIAEIQSELSAEIVDVIQAELVAGIGTAEPAASYRFSPT